jgi:hypothetical protein
MAGTVRSIPRSSIPILFLALILAGTLLAHVAQNSSVSAAPTRQLLLDDPRFGMNAILPDNTRRVPGIARFPWATHAAGLGAKLDRFSLDWQHAEPQAGNFDFAAPDEYVASDIAHGFDTIAVLEHTPFWATNVATTNSSAQVPNGLYLPWNDPGNLWGAYVFAAATHYKGRVAFYELWNEPDLLGGAGWAGSRADYFQLLKVGYLAVKAADPAAQVITGSLNYNPSWLNEVFKADVADPDAVANNYYFDIVGIHSYGRAIAPYSLGESAHAILKNFGISDRPVFATEVGIPVDNDPPVKPSGLIGTTVEAAAYMVESFSAALAGGIDRVLWYRASDVGQPGYWGLFKYSGVTRATAATFTMLSQYFTNITDARLTTSDPITKVVLHEGNQQVTVLWNASPHDVTTTLYAASSGGGTLVDVNGDIAPITPDSAGNYELTLAAATDNHGSNSSDFIVGGAPAIIVETGPFLPTLTPTPSNTPIPTATVTTIPDTTDSSATVVPSASATVTASGTPTASATATLAPTSTPTFPASSSHLYFPEGSSDPRYGDVLQLANIGSSPARVQVSFTGQTGLISSTDVLAAPHALATVDVSALRLPRGAISTSILADKPISAAQGLYYGSSASLVAAQTTTSPDWYLPGIAGVTPTSQQVTLFNPSSQAVAVLVETVTSAGKRQIQAVHIDPFGRRVLGIAKNSRDPELATEVRAEQPIYATYSAQLGRPVAITGAPGISALSRKWYAAEGYHNDAYGDYLALYNPDNRYAAKVQIQLFAPQPAMKNGLPVPAASTSISLPAGTRGTVNLGAFAPRGAYSMLLSSTIRIAVNRMETFGPRLGRVAMVNAVERTSPSWLFPAGDTSLVEQAGGIRVATGISEFLMIFNPGQSKSVPVTVEVDGPTGSVWLRTRISVGPCSRVTLDMNKLIGPGRHLTRVTTADGAQIVAEQSLYFNGSLGGSNGPGVALTAP